MTDSVSPARKQDLSPMEKEETGSVRMKGIAGAWDQAVCKAEGKDWDLELYRGEPQPAPMEQGGQGTVKEPHYPNDAFPSSLREESETRTRLRNYQSGTEQWCLQSSTQLPEESNLDALEENLR